MTILIYAWDRGKRGAGHVQMSRVTLFSHQPDNQTKTMRIKAPTYLISALLLAKVLRGKFYSFEKIVDEVFQNPLIIAILVFVHQPADPVNIQLLEEVEALEPVEYFVFGQVFEDPIKLHQNDQAIVEQQDQNVEIPRNVQKAELFHGSHNVGHFKRLD